MASCVVLKWVYKAALNHVQTTFRKWRFSPLKSVLECWKQCFVVSHMCVKSAGFQGSFNDDYYVFCRDLIVCDVFHHPFAFFHASFYGKPKGSIIARISAVKKTTY